MGKWIEVHFPQYGRQCMCGANSVGGVVQWNFFSEMVNYQSCHDNWGGGDPKEVILDFLSSKDARGKGFIESVVQWVKVLDGWSVALW